MFRILLGLIVLGLILIWTGYRESNLSAVAKDVPQSMSCADLAAKGPGDNAFIELSDFLLTTSSYVYEEKKGRWRKVWVPAVPLHGEYHNRLLAIVNDTTGTAPDNIPLPQDIRVIVQDGDARNDNDVEELASRNVIRGMVINEIAGLDNDTRTLLTESYPHVDFEQCYVFEVGRTPSGSGGLIGYFGGGAALLALGIGGLVFRSRKKAKENEEQTSKDV